MDITLNCMDAPGGPDRSCNYQEAEYKATPGGLDHTAKEQKTEPQAALGGPIRSEPKPLAEWTGDEIESAISEVTDLFSKKLDLDTAQMTALESQEYERQIDYLFAMRETLQIEQIRRDVEALKNAVLAEWLLRFSIRKSGESGQPRRAAFALAQKDAEKRGQPRRTEILSLKRKKRV